MAAAANSQFGAGVVSVWDTTVKYVKAREGVENLILKTITNIFRPWAEATESPLSASSAAVVANASKAQGFVNLTKLITKTDAVFFQPLPTYSIFSENTLKPSYEVIAKKTSQSADLVGSLCDLTTLSQQYGFSELSKEWMRNTVWLRTVTDTITATHGIVEDATKVVTGKVVNPNDGSAVDLTATLTAHTWFKLAMNISYLALAIISVFSLCGVVVPYLAVMRAVLLTVATVSTIASYYIKHVGADLKVIDSKLVNFL